MNGIKINLWDRFQMQQRSLGKFSHLNTFNGIQPSLKKINKGKIYIVHEKANSHWSRICLSVETNNLYKKNVINFPFLQSEVNLLGAADGRLKKHLIFSFCFDLHFKLIHGQNKFGILFIKQNRFFEWVLKNSWTHPYSNT